MIDLHTHSTASDGTFQPRELVVEAIRLGLSALALTDHDTVDGLAEAEAAARGTGLRFVRGVELGIDWEPGECHLLGLGFGEPSAALTEALADLAREREARNHLIIDLMTEGGVEVDYDEVRKFSAGKVIGRPHFAALLVAKKIVRNREEAFSLYLAKGRPFYAPKVALDLEQAIKAIKESGGAAVLAHPLSLYVAWGKLGGLLAEWKRLGLDGLEAYHPAAKPGPCQRLEKLGRELGFLITAGSDFHGANRENRYLGYGPARKAIDDCYLEGIPLSPEPEGPGADTATAAIS